MDHETLVNLTADIVAAHVANNSTALSDLPILIANVHGSLSDLAAGPPAPAEPKSPAVPIKTSVNRDFLVCLECGRKLKMLRRHLITAHDMTPEQYRRDYDLPFAYPLTAPAYSKLRRKLAHSIGLGKQHRNPKSQS